MKKLILALVLLALIATPVFAQVPHGGYSDNATMNYTRINGYYQGQGGEFTLKQKDSLYYLSNSAYDKVAKGEDGNATSFQTFCMEIKEFVAQPLDLYVSNQDASLSVFGSHAWKGGGAGDDLDFKTAYLYNQFATGQLNYAYTGTVAGLNRAQSAGALQRVIWSIEGEGGSDFSTSFQGISLIAAQQTQASNWLIEATNAGWTDIGNVRILQAYNTSGGLAQDQLYLIPLPGAALLGLLGFGVAGFKLRRKKV